MIESSREANTKTCRSIDSIKALRYAKVPLISDPIKKEAKVEGVIDQNQLYRGKQKHKR